MVFTGIRFRQEREKAATPTTVGPEVTDGVVLFATVLSLDPAQSEMTIRLIPVPAGSYGRLGFLKPVNLVIGTSNGVSETEIKVGSPITPLDLTTSLVESQVTNYPFDSYKADLGVLVVPPENAAPDGQPTSPTGGSDTATAPRLSPVPIQLRVASTLHGYEIVAKPSLEQTGDFGEGVTEALTSFDVRRSGATRFFAVFVMVLMWAISIGVLWIALSILFRRRQIEAAILSMFGIVLFALPNIRNVQPNAPPIGSLTDILAFFWCESLVAACLVAMIIVFVRRSQESPRQSQGGRSPGL